MVVVLGFWLKKARSQAALAASAAGYAPAAQLAFIAGQAASAEKSLQLVATHPAAAARLRQLQLRLPLAERLRSRAE